MAATKKRRATTMSNERLAVVESRLENVVTQTAQTQSDVKTILTEIGSLKVTLATLPNWEAVKAMDKEQRADTEANSTRIAALEVQATEAKSSFRATWATIVVVSILISTLVGWGISIFVH